MTSLTNPGNTSKNLYSFESGYVVPKDFSGICEIKNSICYYKDGKLHREDGPMNIRKMKYIIVFKRYSIWKK